MDPSAQLSTMEKINQMLVKKTKEEDIISQLKNGLIIPFLSKT